MFKLNEFERCAIFSWRSIQWTNMGLSILLKQNKFERCAIFSRRTYAVLLSYFQLAYVTMHGYRLNKLLKHNKFERCAIISRRSMKCTAIGVKMLFK
jgi:hypothetical protein